LVVSDQMDFACIAATFAVADPSSEVQEYKIIKD
jgi:hypothetical protein